MIAPDLAAALAAPLAAHPNHRTAEIRFLAERDHASPLDAALQLWTRDREVEPELALIAGARA